MSFTLRNQRTGQVEHLSIRKVLEMLGNPVDNEINLGGQVYEIDSCVDTGAGGSSQDVRFAYHSFRKAEGVILRELRLAYLPTMHFVQVFVKGQRLMPTDFVVKIATATVTLTEAAAAALQTGDYVDVYYAHVGTEPVRAGDVGMEPTVPVYPVTDPIVEG